MYKRQITTLDTFSICNNQLTGDLPSALRTGVTLLGYPTADGYTPIACQNAVSNIVFTAPQNLKVGRNFTLEIDASDYFTEDSSYTVSCGEALSVDSTRLTSVSRAADTCTFTVDPIDTLVVGSQGDATFTVPLTSTGGHTLNATFTVNIGPDSSVSVSAPSSIAVAASRSRTVDFSDYASDGSYTISCGTPTTASSLITIGTPTGCSVAITAGASTGQASVSVVFTSEGGATATGSFTFDVGAASNIVFSAPTGLKVATNRTRVINCLLYTSPSPRD